MISSQPTRNILRAYRASSDDTRAAGSTWYGAALLICEEQAAAYGVTVEQAACVMAHLSPRQSWSKNVEASHILLSGHQRPGWIMTRSWDAAHRALLPPSPWGSFSDEANKTRSFARAIVGDPDAVTVDIWAARVAGIDPNSLRRVGGYDAAADAYRRAAKRVDVIARDLQAICWVHVRGNAA